MISKTDYKEAYLFMIESKFVMNKNFVGVNPVRTDILIKQSFTLRNNLFTKGVLTG